MDDRKRSGISITDYKMKDNYNKNGEYTYVEIRNWIGLWNIIGKSIAR